MEELIFRESDHSYWIGNQRIISVTQALSILDDRWKVDPFYLERGRFIHKATELYDLDELDDSTVDPQIRPYLDAYINFRCDAIFEPIRIEKKYYHPKLMYAGKIDRIGPLNDRLSIIDLKSGVKAKVDELQGTAYWELCLSNDIPIHKVFDLYLKDDSTYSLVEIEKPKLLLPVFLACLTVMRWKEGL